MSKNSIYKILVISILTTFTCARMTAQDGTVTINQDDKIPVLLETKKKLEEDNKLTNGFTIQLGYYDTLGRANSVLRKYQGLYGAWPASIEYETPNYKVWAGNFGTRLEADRALMEIKNSFSSAFILKPNK